MNAPRIAGYGSWKSPITSDIVASGAIGFDGQIEIDEGNIYWVEMRPAEGGRYVVVCHSSDGQIIDVTPEPFNVRTRVHEYGGGAFVVDGGTVYFSNFSDQSLYRQNPGAKPEPVTPEGAMRYADGVVDYQRRRIICVCEDHTVNDKEPVNTLAGINIDGSGTIQQLVSGNDFYSSPRVSPDGSQMAWLTWNHPNMPWDYTELWVAHIEDDGTIRDAVRIAGGSDESICQPRYSTDGMLYFISEKTGWWNLYRWRDGRVEPLHEMEAEFGQPHWGFGISSYGFDSSRRLICSYIQNGLSHLAALDTVTLSFDTMDIPYTSISTVKAAREFAILIAGSPGNAESVVKVDLASGKTEVLRRSTDVKIEPRYLSMPEAIEFPTENNLTAHALYYRPKNDDFTAPLGEKPPLIIMSHGGPTSATSSTFNLAIQYWTSRGFTVADVNYGGSTGYGRAYRQRLDGQWGIVDVDDCVNCARYLIERGKVDGERAAIRGGSAGGYTTLAALTFRETFKVGASYYGISDLEALAKDTHKFESRYLDRIVGRYPERRDLYLERSPINFVDRLSCPVIFFQGDEDRVVPPNQAKELVNALRRKGIPVSYILFEGEQHGFRKAQNIKRAIDAELYFYSRIFGFELADDVQPVLIENLA